MTIPSALFTFVPTDATAFLYGSRVYGTAQDHSDFDLAVVHDAFKGEEERLVGSINAHLYEPAVFQAKLDAHDVVALECWFAPPSARKIGSATPTFSLDRTALRSAFSQKASQAFVKAKKKITVENDFYIGRKSLWHALRILRFGHQIATQGRITDFGAANDLYEEIVYSTEEDWDAYKRRYQGVYNALATRFKATAPKA